MLAVIWIMIVVAAVGVAFYYIRMHAPVPAPVQSGGTVNIGVNGTMPGSTLRSSSPTY